MFSTCPGENATLVVEMTILSVVKWNMEFNLCPPRSKSKISSFCDRCLSESFILSPKPIKWSNIICTSHTKGTLGSGGLKLNTPLKNFLTERC